MKPELNKIYKINDNYVELIQPYTTTGLFFRNLCKAIIFLCLCDSFATFFKPNDARVYLIFDYLIIILLIIGLIFISNKKTKFNLESEEIICDSEISNKENIYTILDFSNIEYIYVSEKYVSYDAIREINIMTQIQDTPITLLTLNKSKLFRKDYYTIKELNEIAFSLSEILNCEFIEGQEKTEINILNNKPVKQKIEIDYEEINPKYEYVFLNLFVLIPIIAISILTIYRPLKAIIKSMTSNVSISSTQINKNEALLDKIKQSMDKKNYESSLVQEEPTE